MIDKSVSVQIYECLLHIGERLRQRESANGEDA